MLRYAKGKYDDIDQETHSYEVILATSLVLFVHANNLPTFNHNPRRLNCNRHKNQLRNVCRSREYIIIVTHLITIC